MLIYAWIKNLSCWKQIQCYFEKFMNRISGGYKMIWKLSYGN